MKNLPIAEWLASLERIETSLAQVVLAADGYEAAFGSLFAEASIIQGNVGVHDKLAAIEGRLAEYDQRMAAVAELAESVEKSIGEREAAALRWRETCSRWAKRIEQGATHSPGDLVVRS